MKGGLVRNWLINTSSEDLLQLALLADAADESLLQDSKRCLAELRLETRGKPDLALSCAVYSRNHC